MNDEPTGMEAKSNDYLDAIEDMILFLQSFNLEKEDDREALAAALIEIEISRNVIKQARFIEQNLLGAFLYPRIIRSGIGGR